MSDYIKYDVKDQDVFHLKRLGDFKKVKSLGGGGFGEVFLVEPINKPEGSEISDKYYALKVSKRYRSKKEAENLKRKIFFEQNKENKELQKKLEMQAQQVKKAQEFNSATCTKESLELSKEQIELEKFIKAQIDAIEEPAPKATNHIEVRECNFLSRLRGENYIIQSYEFCFSPDKTCSYILMEYVETKIMNYLYDCNYNPVKVNEGFFRKFTNQLLLGVKTIHDHDIIHRDIKPDNILFVPKLNQIKISDFGLGRKISHDAKEYTNAGTLNYKPLDVILGNKFYGYSFDMWSIGVTLAEFLIGKTLFEGQNAIEILRSICRIFGEIDESLLPGVALFPYYGALKKAFETDSKINKNGYGLRKYLKENAKFKVGESFYDLIESLLVIEPCKRSLCSQALESAWLHEE